jgi:hypothetical protein
MRTVIPSEERRLYRQSILLLIMTQFEIFGIQEMGTAIPRNHCTPQAYGFTPTIV